MPFTPAHVAAVLPLVGTRRPRWVVPSALVIGSMVPDLLYFVPIRSDRNLSHSLTGIVTLDLVLGLLCVALWRVVAAPVVRDLSPDRLRSRIPLAPPATVTEALWAVPCVVLGALTHVLWDSFTHENGWAVERLPFLTAELGLPVFKLAQYGSGVIGCAVVIAYALRSPEVPRAPDDAPRAPERQRVAALALLVAVPAVCAVAAALSDWLAGAPTEVLLYDAVVRGVSGLGLAAGALATWWHLTVRGRAVAVAREAEKEEQAELSGPATEAAAGADHDRGV